MKDTHDKVHEPDDRGICSTCDHVTTCRLHSEDKKPVFFCEEFACSLSDSVYERQETLGTSGNYGCQIAVSKPENARLAYLGLCKDCSELTTCVFLKPGGGTWQCDSYEASASR
jgi:hypothetical protein